MSCWIWWRMYRISYTLCFRSRTILLWRASKRFWMWQLYKLVNNIRYQLSCNVTTLCNYWYLKYTIYNIQQLWLEYFQNINFLNNSIKPNNVYVYLFCQYLAKAKSMQCLKASRKRDINVSKENKKTTALRPNFTWSNTEVTRPSEQ